MIEKIEVSGSDYKVEEPLRKYVEKRIGKLDRYLPRGSKKDVVLKVIVSSIGKSKGEKYEISAAMDIPGGKVIAAKDECSNVFAGIDLVEAKLTGQIRRYKLEVQPHRQKRSLRKLFIKRK
ncbi:ribosome-associated translation inhibitor RaiA [Candidatus Saccharibacteria bacterium]|nr:ribosome-associated translation inhibitor RaiA [Candidatus Saccharibacteria bacterium]MDO5475133.1 ribosome-associated translation inhibitor RaiA [Candidatus Saccharibacteria bacterium]